MITARPASRRFSSNSHAFIAALLNKANPNLLPIRLKSTNQLPQETIELFLLF